MYPKNKAFLNFFTDSFFSNSNNIYKISEHTSVTNMRPNKIYPEIKIYLSTLLEFGCQKCKQFLSFLHIKFFSFFWYYEHIKSNKTYKTFLSYFIRNLQCHIDISAFQIPPYSPAVSRLKTTNKSLVKIITTFRIKLEVAAD